jgi:hypothetical protein
MTRERIPHKVKLPSPIPLMILAIGVFFTACSSDPTALSGDTDVQSALRLRPDDQHHPPSGVTISPTLVLSESPAKSQVYEMEVRTNVGEEYVHSIATRVGLTGEPTYYAKAGYWMIDDGAAGILMVFSNGAFSTATERQSLKQGEITDEAAKTIAQTYLSDKQLLPEDAQFYKIARDGLGDATVWYASAVLGKPGNISGAPAITVDVSSEGQVLGFSSNWPALKPMGEYNIVSQAEAARRLLNGIWYNSMMPGAFDSVSIDWLMRKSDSGASFVFPCYLFVSGESFARVPALADEYLSSK